VAVITIHGGNLEIHMLGPGATLGHTVEKIPETLGKSIERLLDSWLSKKAESRS
jgi:hypothetical protein